MVSDAEIGIFEKELCSFSPQVRQNALSELAELLQSGKFIAQEKNFFHNLHCHTFYSYNGYGFSPERIVWMAKKCGHFAVGMVDFDVLDAVEEFLKAAKLLDVRAVCGLESRVFMPEFAAFEMNSPGEPGIAYNMGCGFTSSAVPPEAEKFAAELRNKAAERTLNIVKLVNRYLSPVELDFDRDAVRLTPKGNVTERHVCQAYREKAAEKFPNAAELADFWAAKLGVSPENAKDLVKDNVALEGMIRSKTMKQGGVGYVQPDAKSFPTINEMNNFTRQCGALPSMAWLNGLSVGENQLEKYLDYQQKCGAELVNFVPDRNWNVKDKEKQKALVYEMDRLMESCKKRGLPVAVGTELNAPGLKMVDDFDVPYLAKYLNDFVDGAAIVYAHSVMQKLGKGLLSDWAAGKFSDRFARNAFYARLGRALTPANAADAAKIMEEI